MFVRSPNIRIASRSDVLLLTFTQLGSCSSRDNFGDIQGKTAQNFLPSVLVVSNSGSYGGVLIR